MTVSVAWIQGKANAGPAATIPFAFDAPTRPTALGAFVIDFYQAGASVASIVDDSSSNVWALARAIGSLNSGKGYTEIWQCLTNATFQNVLVTLNGTWAQASALFEAAVTGSTFTGTFRYVEFGSTSGDTVYTNGTLSVGMPCVVLGGVSAYVASSCTPDAPLGLAISDTGQSGFFAAACTASSDFVPSYTLDGGHPGAMLTIAFETATFNVPSITGGGTLTAPTTALVPYNAGGSVVTATDPSKWFANLQATLGTVTITSVVTGAATGASAATLTLDREIPRGTTVGIGSSSGGLTNAIGVNIATAAQATSNVYVIPENITTSVAFIVDSFDTFTAAASFNTMSLGPWAGLTIPKIQVNGVDYTGAPVSPGDTVTYSVLLASDPTIVMGRADDWTFASNDIELLVGDVSGPGVPITIEYALGTEAPGGSLVLQGLLFTYDNPFIFPSGTLGSFTITPLTEGGINFEYTAFDALGVSIAADNSPISIEIPSTVGPDSPPPAGGHYSLYFSDGWTCTVRSALVFSHVYVRVQTVAIDFLHYRQFYACTGPGSFSAAYVVTPTPVRPGSAPTYNNIFTPTKTSAPGTSFLLSLLNDDGTPSPATQNLTGFETLNVFGSRIVSVLKLTNTSVRVTLDVSPFAHADLPTFGTDLAFVSSPYASYADFPVNWLVDLNTNAKTSALIQQVSPTVSDWTVANGSFLVNHQAGTISSARVVGVTDDSVFVVDDATPPTVNAGTGVGRLVHTGWHPWHNR
jgi:hypothetical protein